MASSTDTEAEGEGEDEDDAGEDGLVLMVVVEVYQEISDEVAGQTP
jgi:hypothetical protein